MMWDKVFPYVMMAYWSSVQSSTGYTPCMVLFGLEICLPVDVISSINVLEEFDNPSEYIMKVTELFEIVLRAISQFS